MWPGAVFCLGPMGPRKGILSQGEVVCDENYWQPVNQSISVTTHTQINSGTVSLALALNVNISRFEHKNHCLWPTWSAFSRNDEYIVIFIYPPCLDLICEMFLEVTVAL